eukprot:GGOE01003136.1.p1 GENE.GGOE01003136.1~~GGOE01003136.1.p1  ORF type:complete len:521 (-),score=99.52 GGOE01003136.1:497-2059(-)
MFSTPEDVLQVIDSDIRANNELYGLLLEAHLNREAVFAQLKKCTTYSNTLLSSNALQGQLFARLTALVQIQNHVISKFADCLCLGATKNNPIANIDIPTVVCSSRATDAFDAVKTRLPHIPDAIVEKVLESNGNDVNQAVELILLPDMVSASGDSKGTPKKPEGNAEESAEMWKLKMVFPNIPEETAALALSHTDNDPDRAINLLLVQGAAWAMSAPVQQLAEMTMTPTRVQRPGATDADWGATWMGELMPGVAPNEVQVALKSSRGNVLRAFKMLKEQRQKEERGKKAEAIRRHSPSNSPSAAMAAAPGVLSPTVSCSQAQAKLELEIARRLARADVAPSDFFQLNSRLMITTKRRVSEVMASRDVPPREAKILVGQERLKDRLRCLGLKEVPMADDGNCQFRSFAHQLFGSQDQHMKVRQSVVYQMRTNPQLYSIYFDGDKEYQRYLDRMGKEKVWGDEMTLKAFCDYFGVVVHLVLSSGSRWYHKMCPDKARDSSRQIAMAFLCPIHYNAITTVDGR